MLIDTHTHLNFEAFSKDWKVVLENCLAEDMAVINIGSNFETSKKAVEIAEKYPKNVYAAIGVHPIHAKERFDADEFKKLSKSSKIVAVGEIGLDKFKDYGKFFEDQKALFLKQLDFAKEANLPVIVHCRMAHGDLQEILNSQWRGTIHCFTGTWEDAKKYLDMGFYLGINGIIRKFDLKEVIEKAPLDRLLLETDSPYLGKEERNTPLFVKEIAKDIARIRNISFDEVSQATTRNARSLFGI